MVGIEIVRVLGEADASREGHHPRRVRHRIDREHVERVHPVVEQLAPRGVHVPPQTEVQSQLWRDLPVVLNIRTIIDDPAANRQHLVDTRALYPTELERRDALADSGVVEAENATGGVAVQIVIAGAAPLEAELQAVVAFQPEQVLRQLCAHDWRLDALHVRAFAERLIAGKSDPRTKILAHTLQSELLVEIRIRAT